MLLFYIEVALLWFDLVSFGFGYGFAFELCVCESLNGIQLLVFCRQSVVVHKMATT